MSFLIVAGIGSDGELARGSNVCYKWHMPFNSRHWNPRFINQCDKKKDPFRGAIRFSAAEKQAWKLQQIAKIQQAKQAPLKGLVEDDKPLVKCKGNALPFTPRASTPETQKIV